jgi:hypothetical protein
MGAYCLPALFLLSLSLPSCAHADPIVSDQVSIAQTDEDALVQQAMQAIISNHLTKVRQECLAIDVDSQSAKTVLLDVREHHGDDCPGDPATEPHIFTIKIDRSSGKMASDAKLPGTFKPLK